ncbi:MAG: HupE/UreJ family protein [Pseudomonadota bacterium]
MSFLRTLVLVVASALILPSVALAHSAEGIAGGAISGFLHPLAGPDHLLAMLAVGLWGAQLGRPLIYALPIVFPLIMALGGVLGIMSVPMIAVELGIALSALVLGLAIIAAFRAPVPIAIALVALFAVFHGYAHGAELPSAAEPLAYGLGFVVATGLVHLAGVAIGLLNERPPAGPTVVRAGGGFVALSGAYFTAAAVGIV